jgi:hypothetical protein
MIVKIGASNKLPNLRDHEIASWLDGGSARVLRRQ